MMEAFDLEQYKQSIAEATAAIRERHAEAPRFGIICGTGMGGLADRVEEKTVIPYQQIPHFPLSTVESHSGNLMLGRLSAQPVVVMQGRFHRYEGYSLREVTFPVRVMRALGCEALIVMNAVGSMNPLIRRGSIVLVDDHVNFMGDNPLIGPNDEAMGPRFPDMSEPYDPEMRAILRQVALENQIRLEEGVMVAVTGPNLETRAEYRMFAQLGIDIITMSTVPEVIVARHAGMRVVALSTVTDECLPDALRPVAIEEIIATARSAEPRLERLILGLLARIGARGISG
ncbi:MAG TPA: purine-nucleoside phosphorylase [Candidatus Sumerlaeota bacterium]|nr:purine-nucleoside phosphorylase [Candidatus Sumerlaeota bacterium]